MKKNLIWLTLLISAVVYAKGRIQNEDVKSLSDLTSVVSITGNLTSGTACIASPSSTVGISAGLFVYDATLGTRIPSGTTVVALPGTCSAGQIQISQNAAGSATGDTINFGGQASQLINDTKIWVSSVTPAQQLSSAISTGVIGGGAGGSKNYLTTYNGNTGNGNFEFGSTTGWSLGHISALTNGIPSGTPTFGSGASGTQSIAVTSSGPLSGTYSLSYANSAATTVGDMVCSNAFTIDSSDQAKVLTLSGSYAAISGTQNYSGTSSNSFGIAAYDVTNSAWLGVVGNFAMTQSSGVGKFSATTQTNTTTSSVRVCIYNVTATPGAATIYLDDLTFGPQTVPLGVPVTDWVAYSPTISGFGTIGYLQFQSRRVGSSLEIYGMFQAGTIPATTYGSITLGFNGGNGNVVLDTSRLTVNQVLGTAQTAYASTTFFQVVPIYSTATGGGAITFSPITSTTGYTSATYTTTYAASSQYMGIHISVPISGWSSNVQMSNDTDTRVVAAAGFIASTQSIPTATFTNVIWNSGVVDTHGTLNQSTGVYTVPVSGWYQISGALIWSLVSWSSSVSQYAQLYIDGSNFKSLSATTVTTTASQNLTNNYSYLGYFKAGQTIAIAAYQNSGGAVTLAPGCQLNINRLSGPAVVAATETVAMKAYGSSTAINTTTTTVINPTKLYDTHNAYNTTTGVYTIPVSGKYRLSAFFYQASVTTTATAQNVFGTAQGSTGLTNGQFLLNFSFPIATSYVFAPNASITFQATAGEGIYVTLQRGGSVNAFSLDGIGSWISIERIGN